VDDNQTFAERELALDLARRRWTRGWAWRRRALGGWASCAAQNRADIVWRRDIRRHLRAAHATAAPRLRTSAVRDHRRWRKTAFVFLA